MCNRIGATDRLELVEKRGDMKLNRVDRNSEAARYRFVRRALGQKAQDLYFAWRERGVLLWSFLVYSCGDYTDVSYFVQPRQAKPWDIRKERRQAVSEGRIVHLDREDNQLRGDFAAQASGLSRTVRWASVALPPRRKVSLTVVPIVSGPSACKSIRTA